MSKFTILLKTTLVITCACVITSCATQSLSIPENQSVSKIAILSELDNEMNTIKIGSNDDHKESIQHTVTAWDINHNIENDLAQKLWAKGIEVVVLETNSTEIMQEKTKLRANHNSYKGAQLVVIVKPIYQSDDYPLIPSGYGIVEKTSLGIKHRLMYASIIYEVYSTQDGARKGYYVVQPEGSNVVKLKKDISMDQLTESKIVDFKPQLYQLFDQTNNSAIKKLGLNQ
jgi:hypothetical protein